MPPDDRNTITKVLPKQSNLSPVKPLNTAVSFQKKNEKEKKMLNCSVYTINKIQTVENSVGQTSQVFQKIKKKKIKVL